MNQLAKAVMLSSVGHLDQVDKGGNPYILHPIWVMTRLDNEEEKQAGVMHDLVEDTDMTLEELAQEHKFDYRVCLMIDNVTKRKGEPYWKLIDRAFSDAGSTRIKKLDIRHNSNILRVKGFGQDDINRIRKYQLAFHYLETGDIKFREQLIDHINYCG